MFYFKCHYFLSDVLNRIFGTVSNFLTCNAGHFLTLNEKNVNLKQNKMLFNKINQIQNLALYLQINFNGIFHGLTEI